MESTYTDKEIVKAYLEKLQRKRKFTGKEAGIILFLININIIYGAKDKSKYIDDIDIAKLARRAQRSLNGENYDYEVYRTLHATLDAYRKRNQDLFTLWICAYEAILDSATLTFEIENACNKEIKTNGRLYNMYSLNNILEKNKFSISMQYEDLANTLRHLLAYDELLKILEKEYKIYNLCDCYGLNNEEFYIKRISTINKQINYLKKVLPQREEDINKVFPLINFEVFKPSKKNIKKVKEQIKEIGFNYGAVTEYRYNIDNFIGTLQIDCIDDWELKNPYNTIKIINDINKKKGNNG